MAENIRSDDEGPRPPEGHLWDYVHVVLRRRTLVLAVFVAVACAAAVRSFLTRPVYQATAQILIERVDPNVLSFKGVTEEKAGGGIDDYYQTQYKLLQSRTLARHVVETNGLLADPELGGPRTPEQVAALIASAPGRSPEMEGVVDAFLGRVRVQPVRNSRLVSVSFEAFRPELAAAAANALSKAYIQQALDLRSGTSAEAGEWLGTQIAEQRKKVDELTARMRSVEHQDGIVNVAERRTLLDQRLKELGSSLNDRKTERLQKEALWGQMRSAPNPEELPEAMRSPMVQSLRMNLARAGAQAGGAARALHGAAPRGGEGPAPRSGRRARASAPRRSGSSAPPRTTTRRRPRRRRASPAPWRRPRRRRTTWRSAAAPTTRRSASWTRPCRCCRACWRATRRRTSPRS